MNMHVREGYMNYLGYKTYYRIVGECKGGKNLWCFFMAVLVLHTTTLKYWIAWQKRGVQLSPMIKLVVGTHM